MSGLMKIVMDYKLVSPSLTVFYQCPDPWAQETDRRSGHKTTAGKHLKCSTCMNAVERPVPLETGVRGSGILNWTRQNIAALWGLVVNVHWEYSAIGRIHRAPFLNFNYSNYRWLDCKGGLHKSSYFFSLP